MRIFGHHPDEFGARPERHGEDVLRGRLGHELALIYHDTFQAALPARLQQIVERLDDAMNRHLREESRDAGPDLPLTR